MYICLFMVWYIYLFNLFLACQKCSEIIPGFELRHHSWWVSGILNVLGIWMSWVSCLQGKCPTRYTFSYAPIHLKFIRFYLYMNNQNHKTHILFWGPSNNALNSRGMQANRRAVSVKDCREEAWGHIWGTFSMTQVEMSSKDMCFEKGKKLGLEW